jgi:hypothetical protein
LHHDPNRQIAHVTGDAAEVKNADGPSVAEPVIDYANKWIGSLGNPLRLLKELQSGILEP